MDRADNEAEAGKGWAPAPAGAPPAADAGGAKPRAAPLGPRRLNAFYEPLRLRGPALAGLVVGASGFLIAFLTVLGRRRVSRLLPRIGLSAAEDTVALVGGGLAALLGLAAVVLAIRSIRRIRGGADGPAHRPLAGFALLLGLAALGLGAVRPLAERAARAVAAAERREFERARDMTGRPLDELVACLRDPRDDVRRAAAFALMGRPEAESALLSLLAEGNGRAQWLAAERLIRNGSRAPALVAFLERGLRDAAGCREAVELLVLADAAALPAIRRALADPDPEMQKLGYVIASGLLVERWERPAEVAAAVSRWLARRTHPGDPALRDGLADLADLLEHPEVRLRALAQLAACLEQVPQEAGHVREAAALSAEAIWSALDAVEPWRREQAAALLVHIASAKDAAPTAMASRLVALLGPRDDAIVLGALDALAHIGEAAADAVPALIELVARARDDRPRDEWSAGRTPTCEVALAAVRLLTTLAPHAPEAAAALGRFAGDATLPDPVRAAAAGR